MGNPQSMPPAGIAKYPLRDNSRMTLLQYAAPPQNPCTSTIVGFVLIADSFIIGKRYRQMNCSP